LAAWPRAPISCQRRSRCSRLTHATSAQRPSPRCHCSRVALVLTAAAGFSTFFFLGIGMLSAAPVRWLVAIDCTAELAGTTRRKDQKKTRTSARRTIHQHGMAWAGEASQEGRPAGPEEGREKVRGRATRTERRQRQRRHGRRLRPTSAAPY
jgi:hypothetical protein